MGAIESRSGTRGAGSAAGPRSTPGRRLFCALGQFRVGKEGRGSANDIELRLTQRLSPAQRRSCPLGFQAHGRGDWIAVDATGVAGKLGLPTEVECRRKAVVSIGNSRLAFST